MAENVIQIKEYGPLFELKPPHTVESIREGARSAGDKRRGLCRIKHRWQTVGEPYLPEDDLVTTVCSLIASSVFDRLVRCKRCGRVAMKERWS